MATTTLTPVDISTIKATTEPWTNACVARDWDALLGLCADDVVFFPPDEPPVSGKQVRPWLENYPEVKSFVAEMDHVEGQDHLAVAHGHFTMVLMPPGATETVTFAGKFVDSFRRDAHGAWKYAGVIWNSSLPSPPLRGLAGKAAGAPLQALDLVPSLTVDDLPKSIDFFEGLGFIVVDRWEQDGKLLGVMLGGGGAQIGLMQDDGAKGKNRVKGVGSRLFMETNQSVDQLAARAKSAGVALARDPYDTPWNSRAMDVVTAEGFAITISTPMT